MNDNTCVCCGEQIPEGRQICPKCEKGGDTRMTLEEILEKLHSPTEHAITLENGELTALLEELKELREENKVLISECDRLIKEKGELLKRHEQTGECKRLLKAAVDDMRDVANNGTCNHCVLDGLYAQGGCCTDGCFKWRYADEALKLIGGD